MNQTLEQLIKLQGIDHRLLEIKDYMGDLPSMVENQEKELETLNFETKEKQSRIAEIEKEIRQFENEIEDMNAKMKKYIHPASERYYTNYPMNYAGKIQS